MLCSPSPNSGFGVNANVLLSSQVTVGLNAFVPSYTVTVFPAVHFPVMVGVFVPINGNVGSFVTFNSGFTSTGGVVSTIIFVPGVGPGNDVLLYSSVSVIVTLCSPSPNPGVGIGYVNVLLSSHTTVGLNAFVPS
jgi:hypothetical protein